jgi:hypothetical protein
LKDGPGKAPDFGAVVGPHAFTQKIHFGTSVSPPLQVSDFGAVSSKSGPGFQEDCNEAISLQR